MKEEWEYKKLGEVASYINGFAFKPSQWSDTGTPIVRIQNLNNPEASYNYYDGVLPDKVKIKKGDLLISWSASLGAYLWMGDEAYLNQHIFKVQFDKLDIDKMFLKYAVSSKLDVMANLVHGATMKHIVKSDFDKTRIPYPPKPTQLSIVSELDKLNELIQIKKEQLKDYDALAQSIFYEMFGDPVENEKGWEVMLLADVCHSITDGDHMPPPKTDSGIPFLTISNINKETRILDFSDTFFVPQSYYVALKESRKPMENDLLYTVTGSYGIPVVVDGKNSFCFQRHIALLRPNVDKVLTLYLCYWCLCPSIKQVADKVATGIAQKTVSLTSLRKFSIILPPLSLQQSFAHKIEQIERQKAAVQSTITDLETLLAARMQYWFD